MSAVYLPPPIHLVYYRRPDGRQWRLNHACGFESLTHAKASADGCSRLGFDSVVNDATGTEVYFVAAAPRPGVST